MRSALPHENLHTPLRSVITLTSPNGLVLVERGTDRQTETDPDLQTEINPRVRSTDHGPGSPRRWNSGLSGWFVNCAGAGVASRPIRLPLRATEMNAVRDIHYVQARSVGACRR